MTLDLRTFDQARDKLDCLEGSGRSVYGIERVVLSGSSIIPDLNGIADFSEVADASPDISIAAAKKFLSEYGQDENERFVIEHS